MVTARLVNNRRNLMNLSFLKELHKIWKKEGLLGDERKPLKPGVFYVFGRIESRDAKFCVSTGG